MATRHIYIKFDEGQEPQNLNDLFRKLFSFQSGIEVKNVPTYTNRDCTNLQCDANRYRSFDDILRIAERYFPGTSYLDVFRELLRTEIRGYGGRLCNLSLGSCSFIRKQRMHYSAYAVTNYRHACGQPQYRSRYSWRELFDAIGITSQEQLQQLIEQKV